MKILFFIDSLQSGGQERRMLELLIYLKINTTHQIRLVLTDDKIHYNYFKDYEIHTDIIKRSFLRKDPSLFFKFYRIAKNYNPDIIHTWGVMTTFYAIPAKIILKKPLLANLVADANGIRRTMSFESLFRSIDVRFSDVILANSMAGIKSYNLQSNPKVNLIYNGVRLDRFKLSLNKEDVRIQFGIKTSFVAIMVASASKNKDYDLFLDVAKKIAFLRDDITFVGVGDGADLNRLKIRIKKEKIENVLLLGKRNDVEHIIQMADICLLFTHSTHSEGISNSILEYMSMVKPVITTDMMGGSCEIIVDAVTGYIIEPNAAIVSDRIIHLINNPSIRDLLGENARDVVHQKFSIDRMGKEYLKLYNKTFNFAG
jgi:glycosyltransferase involved in cell wall biosynthesis